MCIKIFNMTPEKMEGIDWFTKELRLKVLDLPEPDDGMLASVIDTFKVKFSDLINNTKDEADKLLNQYSEREAKENGG